MTDIEKLRLNLLNGELEFLTPIRIMLDVAIEQLGSDAPAALLDARKFAGLREKHIKAMIGQDTGPIMRRQRQREVLKAVGILN